jgi:hypothetical protein
MKNSFIQQTALSLVETIEWKQLSRTTLVLPSHRAGLVLKNELLRLQRERQAQAIWAPQLLTLTQLQDALSPLYDEDELFTIVRLYKRYLSSFDSRLSATPMSLDMFYGWGRQMLADFTNIDASMPADQVPNFFENTIAAHELEEWKLDEETEQRLRSLMKGASSDDKTPHADSVQEQYRVLWRQLFDLYQGLRDEMLAEQKGYAGMRQRAVIEQWDDENIQKQIAGRTYVFIGFNYLLPVERELMLRLRDNGQALFYWDYIPDFETNTKAFSFTKQNRDILGGTVFPSSADTQAITVLSCSSKEAQAQYVHEWLQENYTEKGQKVGVVICDETMLEPVIYTLPPITLPGQTEPEPINITKGFPLRNTHIYAQVLAYLYDKKNGNAEEVVSPDFIDHLLEAITSSSANPQTPSSTNPLTWHELLVLESEYQVRKICNQMRLLLTNGLGEIPFTLKLLRLLMRRTMESVTMPFHGEPITDIQVLGVLETRLLDFDKLLLLNVEEGVVPQQQNDLSFIPYYLRKTYHMQTSDERATVYAYNFFRLLSRAGEATLLFAAADTAEGSKGMSRFIMQLLVSDRFQVTKGQLQEQSIVAKIDEERFGTNNVRFEGARLSPTALNTYIDCPRKFCFQYILGLKEVETEETQFENNTLGSFVHYTIEDLYKTHLNCDNSEPVRVTPEQIRAINTPENRNLALVHAYEKMNRDWLKDHPDDPQHYVLEDHAPKENIIIDGYVQNILERDEQDATEGLQIYLLEAYRYFELPIQGDRSVSLGGKIDRLDICGAPGNERLRIVDYKTGSFKSDKLSASMDTVFESKSKSYVRQILIYSHAVMLSEEQELPIEPNLFFCRHKLTDIKTTLSVDRKVLTDYSKIQADFLDSLSAKVNEIMSATHFPPCEEKDCTSYCPFLKHCGRKAWERD